MRTRRNMAALFLALLLCSSLAFASPAKTYQVTGPVLEVRSDMIAVQKGKDRWEIARDASTKVTGDLKVGAKVTIVPVYRWTLPLDRAPLLDDLRQLGQLHEPDHDQPHNGDLSHQLIQLQRDE